VRESKSSKKSASSEIEISNACYSITEKYPIDEILAHAGIDYNKTLPNIVYICKNKTGHGSINQIRNHLEVLTSEKAPFKMDKIVMDNKKKKIIRKRTEDDSS
jgi:hypothetical protein